MADTLEISTEQNVVIIRFVSDALLDSSSIQAVGDELAAQIETAPHPNVLLDFEHVRYLSSPGLSMLLAVRRVAEQREIELSLAGLRPELRGLFRLTHLEKVFTCFDTREAALAHLRAKSDA